MNPQMNKCAPVMVVNEVEPCVDFWVSRFGFEKTAEVPHEGKLGFAIVANGKFELMYQSLASAQADVAGSRLTDTALFIDVDDIDAVIARLDGLTPIIPKRDTFYGSTEYWVADPAGNSIGFAQFRKQ